MIALWKAVLPDPLNPKMQVTSRPNSSVSDSGGFPLTSQWRCSPAKRCASKLMMRQRDRVAVETAGRDTFDAGRGNSNATSKSSISLDGQRLLLRPKIATPRVEPQDRSGIVTCESEATCLQGQSDGFTCHKGIDDLVERIELASSAEAGSVTCVSIVRH